MRKQTGKSGIAKKLAVLVLACFTVKLISSIGGGEAVDSLLRDLGENDRLAQQVISFELGVPHAGLDDTGIDADSDFDDAYIAESAYSGETVPSPIETPKSTSQAVNTIAENVPLPTPKTKTEDSVQNMDIINYTSYDIDIASLLAERPAIELQADKPQILIIHTHGSEAYSEMETSRTLDKSKSVVRVGDVLAEELESMGFIVLHDREIYDYPSYSGSYGRSYDSVTRYIEEYPEIQIVIDLHRDSITASDGTKVKTEYEIGGLISSKVMILVSTGEAGLEHPNWMENMRFGVRLQDALDDSYPGLSRPLCVSTERYNQHLAPGYIILEVGTDGNSVSEAELAARLFASAAEPVISELITK